MAPLTNSGVTNEYTGNEVGISSDTNIGHLNPKKKLQFNAVSQRKRTVQSKNITGAEQRRSGQYK